MGSEMCIRDRGCTIAGGEVAIAVLDHLHEQVVVGFEPEAEAKGGMAARRQVQHSMKMRKSR